MGEHVKNKEPLFDLSINPKLVLFGFIVIMGMLLYTNNENMSIPSMQFSLIPTHSGGGAISTGHASVQPQIYTGILDIEISHRDALNMANPREEGKDLVTKFYKKTSNGYMLMGSGDFKGLHVNDYTLFFTVEPNSTDIYVSPSHTADWKLNPRIQDFDFFDIDNDGHSEWVFEFDISGVANPIEHPSFAIYTMSVDEGKAMLTSPSDIDIYPNNSISNINWELIVPEKKGTAIGKVSIILDKTDYSLLDELNSYIKVPYIDNLKLKDMYKVVTPSEIIYSYEFDNDLGNSGYIFTGRNENDHHDIPVRINTNVPESRNLGVTLEVKLINPDSSSTTISDKVNLHATFGADPNTQKLDYEFELDTNFKSAKINWYVNSTEVNSTINYRISYEN